MNMMSTAADWGAKHDLPSDNVRFLEEIGFSKESDIDLIEEEEWS
jgi:hypothetical protein